MNFNTRLKSLINEKGCTQLELAKYVGVKPNTVSDWINKGTSPKISHIYKIQEFFNVTFEYLFTGANVSTMDYLNEDDRELLMYFNELSIRDKHKELGRLQMLVESSNTVEKNVI